MVKKLRHPEDTNDYLDLPDNVVIMIEITYRDRIHGRCLDPHHCTVANALARTAEMSGILQLGRRGVSRQYVSMLLDTRIHPWAESGRWYRGKLDAASADMTVDLDSLAGQPRLAKARLRILKKECAPLPNGDLTVWHTTVITAAPPSERKGYRQGITTRGHRGSGRNKDRVGVPRRQWMPTPLAV